MSAEPQEHARSVASVEPLILRRAAEIKQITLAHALDRAESHISRILSGDYGIRLGELAKFLDTLGLSVIDSDSQSVTLSEKEYQALRTLARKALEDI